MVIVIMYKLQHVVRPELLLASQDISLIRMPYVLYVHQNVLLVLEQEVGIIMIINVNLVLVLTF